MFINICLLCIGTQWIEKPKNENVSTTESFEWVASIVSLSKNPVFKWYKDGSHILRNSSMTIQGAKFTSRLKFPDLNLGDAGTYKVTVEKLDFAGLESDMKLTVFGKCTCTCVNVSVHAHIHACVCAHACLCVCTCMCWCMLVYMPVCEFVCMYVCMYVCIWAHVLMHVFM